MSGAAQDVLILKWGDALSESTRDSLVDKGYSAVGVSEMKDCLKTIEKLRAPLLLVDCGNIEDEVFKYVKQLLGTPQLHTLPIAIVGKEVDSYEDVAKRYFAHMVTITTPCSRGDVTRALDYLSDLVVRAKSTGPQEKSSDLSLEASSALRPKDESSGSMESSSGGSGTEGEAVNELYKELDAIPGVVFAAIGELGLSVREIGAKRYVRQIGTVEAEKLGLLPPDTKIRAAFDESADNAGKWGRGHLLRTSWLVQRFGEALKLEITHVQQGTVAAILMATGMNSRDRELMRRDYLGQRQLMVRKDLSSRLKDSAMRLATEYGQTIVANIVALAAKQLAREEVASIDKDSILSNVLVAADLVDRICYRSGHWDPHAAFGLIRKMKSGKTRELHPFVLASSLKIMSEAIGASGPLLITKKQREDPAVVALEQAMKSRALQPDERWVEISNLTPGMRLSQPLMSFDGKQILGSDLVLDQDLIWRIWQLAAIRPLHGPVVIATTH